MNESLQRVRVRLRRGILAFGCGFILSTAPTLGAAFFGPINRSGEAGATLDVPIALKASDQVSCVQFDLQFDPARLSLGAAQVGDANPAHRVDSAVVEPGRQRVVLYSTTLAPLEGGYVVQVPVTLLAAGDSALNAEAVQLVTPDGALVGLTSTNLAPAIQTDRTSDTAHLGNSIKLEVESIGASGLTYQWLLNGVDIAGATTSQLAIASAQRFHSGTYRVNMLLDGLELSSRSFPVSFADPGPNDARLMALSTRGVFLTGENVMIAGFVFSGSGSKRMLIRAVGPSLIPSGVVDAVPQPAMVLKRFVNGAYVDIAANDDWAANANSAEIIATSNRVGAFALDAQLGDAGMLVDLEAGQYTVVTYGVAETTGVGLVELYDADTGKPPANLTAISTRGFVGGGERIMIAGFVISPEGPKTVLLRAVGPQLQSAGVTAALSDPQLLLYQHRHDAPAEVIFSNDDWSDVPNVEELRTTTSRVGLNAFAEGSKDAALLLTLAPGIYTAQAVGKDQSSGVGLIEVYLVP